MKLFNDRLPEPREKESERVWWLKILAFRSINCKHKRKKRANAADSEPLLRQSRAPVTNGLAEWTARIVWFFFFSFLFFSFTPLPDNDPARPDHTHTHTHAVEFKDAWENDSIFFQSTQTVTLEARHDRPIGNPLVRIESDEFDRVQTRLIFCHHHHHRLLFWFSVEDRTVNCLWCRDWAKTIETNRSLPILCYYPVIF